MSWTQKSHGWDRKRLPGPDPFQHWYRDNQVYFITARCRDGYRVPFWRGEDGHNYFDGCLRDDEQYLRAYPYTLMQAVRARIVRDWREYPHTRVFVDMETGLEFARKHRAFLYGVPYKRYQQRDRDEGPGI